MDECEFCGKPIVKSPQWRGGPKKLFCNESCKNKARYERRLAQLDTRKYCHDVEIPPEKVVRMDNAFCAAMRAAGYREGGQ